ncbi:MAG: energy transducer TonB [Pseudomonas sp.]|nr:energy transducer TonB [Pseudomonas sp.]
MIDELRRRAYLSAMQVVSWLPRQVLPFAAPSRPEWLPPPAELEPEPQVLPAQSRTVAPAAPIEAPRPRVEVPRPQATPRAASVAEAAPSEAAEPAPKALPPPRFSLQLLRAGSCALLVELPTGEAFTRRDPAYLLLKDLLRAAGLPDAPQVIGEPVRWPLLARGSLDQGPHAALEYVQSYVAAQLEQQERCACLWLLGLPAVRYAGEADEAAYNRELQIDGLGAAWALPGLELLMDEPQRKAELWQSMRRLMPRWQTAAVENH